MVRLWLLANPFEALTLSFFTFFTTMTLIALIFRQPRVHEILAPIMAVVIVVFIAAMFARLKAQ